MSSKCRDEPFLQLFHRWSLAVVSEPLIFSANESTSEILHDRIAFVSPCLGGYYEFLRQFDAKNELQVHKGDIHSIHLGSK